MMDQTEKRKHVHSIVRVLDDDLSDQTLSDAERQASLEQLKVYGRDPTGADAIYSKSGITTLSRYAFGSYNPNIVHEALRVIANALLLQPSLQLAILELDGLAQVAKLYQNQDDDFEFLAARVLFVCTYAAQADFTGALSEGILSSIEKHLARHASQADKTRSPEPMEIMAVTETSKLIFNLHTKYPEECKALNASAPDLCTILQHSKNVVPPLNPPVGPILNALACLDFGAVPAQSNNGAESHQGLVARLVNILDESMTHYKPVQLDANGLSLITILRMIYDTSSTYVQADMRKQLFPADSERDLPLGQSSSLASRLLRLKAAPGLNYLSEAISSLLFEMSDKDAGQFVKNIGYGHAAGYLATHKIAIPESIQQATTIGSSSQPIPINPVTGQRLDKEIVPDLPEMTQEEKEREAERLFVLFERLKATGVVNAENPVRQAMQEGRLEEISDDEKE